jgi:hypothetical protein
LAQRPEKREMRLSRIAVKRKEEFSASSKVTGETREPRWVTIEDIRKVKGYEHLSDAEAQRLLLTVRQFASLMANFMHKNYEHE